MQELSQEYILAMVFDRSLDKEELLIQKYKHYYPLLKNKDHKDMIKEFKTVAQEHVTLLKDKMIKLNISP